MMQGVEKLHPFDPTGLTPPKGKHGHSVPTPRLLCGEAPLLASSGGMKGLHQFTGDIMKLDSWSTTDLKQVDASVSSSGGSTVSPVQFYAHRDHSFGGSLSKLERIRNHQDPSIMEPFDETEENENMLSDSTSDSVAKLLTNPSRTASNDQVCVTEDGESLGTSCRSNAGTSGHTNMSLDKLTGDSLLSFSYSAAMGGSGLNPDHQLGGSFVRAFTQGLSTSLTVPGPYLQNTSPTPLGDMGGCSCDQSNLFPTASRNPNKAIITIDAQTSKILMANEMTCELFGYQRSEMSGMKVQNLFTEPYHGEQRALVEQNISSSGETLLVSGKVMDAVTSYRVEFPVSVWMRKVGLDTTHSEAGDMQKPHPHATPTPRVIVVIEPVERSSALFSLSASHLIASCDPWFSCLFGFEDSLEVIGKNVTDLIPSLKLPASLRELPQVPAKQAVTGRAKDGTVFPLTVNFTDLSQCLTVGDLHSPIHTPLQPPNLSSIASYASEDSNSQQASHSNTQEHPSTPFCSSSEPTILSSSDNIGSSSLTEPGYINAKVVVFAALSGMISFFPDGTIHGCNQHFALMLFGYSQQELQKKDITFLLPDFQNHIGYVDDHNMPLPPLDEDDSLFHSAAERSLSPDKAFEYIADFHEKQSRVSPSQKKHQPLLSHGQYPLPLLLPDLSEESGEDKKTSSSTLEVIPDAKQEMVMNGSMPNKKQGMTTLNGLDKKSPVAPTNDIPSVLSISATEREGHLPIHNKLVPSHSTERIMALLSQRDLSTDYHTDTIGGCATEEEGERQLRDVPLSSTPAKLKGNIGNSQEMDRSSLASIMSLPEGAFVGDARHKDGSLMAILFQLKRITLADGQDIYCMWLSRDMDVERARMADMSMSMSRCPSNPHGHNVWVSPEVGLVSDVDAIDGVLSSHQPHLCHLPLPRGRARSEEVIAMEGEYSQNYETLNPLGKGAFGFVRMATKRDDKELHVVVKFLRKSSILKDCWILDKEMGTVPLEISFLARLSHDNIIELLEAYENEYFFQMVMEKHGDGLDLFEFIERNPRLTEKHISYMFRQMVSAIAYLHGNGIVHRDIKDENIIINQYFHIKLIDFGSAAHMGPDKKFSTFCGTLEYCSPEVLLGNSYMGPELEMWALGVTLYTLVFSENPFFDVEESIAGHLQPAFLTSPGLMKLLLWLLHPDPKSRATVSDLLVDKWTNQLVDAALMHFDVVLGHISGDKQPETDPRASNNSDGATGCSHSQVQKGGRSWRGAVKSNSEGGGIVQLSYALRDHMNMMETRPEEARGGNY